MVITPSHFIPLPPAPFAVRFRTVLLPEIFILPSALSPQAALVSRSSSSQEPLPVVTTVISPPVMFMSPSHLTPLAATPSQVMLMVPPLIYIFPESSSSWSVVSPVEPVVVSSMSHWIPSSLVPLMVIVPLSIRKYWAQLIPSPTADLTLMVAFLMVKYSPVLMACFTLPVTFSVPF